MATFPTISGYELEKELKSGGFGTTFLASQKSLERRCVIKILNDNDDEIVKRFVNEARAANAIRNPGIVQIYDIGNTADSRFYLAMEYIDKGSLWDKIKISLALPNRGFVLIIKQIASILKDAHDAEIFHRDLSPGNIMFASEPLVDSGERVKIIDFGLAKVPRAVQFSGMAPVSTSVSTSFGTPGFMAPEAHQSVKAVTSACDVWSLGAIIYYALTHRYVDIDWTAHDPPEPLSHVNKALPQWLSDLVNEMLAFKGSSRPTMAQIIAKIDTQISQTISNPPIIVAQTMTDSLIHLRSLTQNIPVQIHAHSQAHQYGPMAISATFISLDEQLRAIIVRCAANEIIIPLQAVQCVWTHKTKVPCIAVEGLFIGNPAADWWYYSK